MNEDVEHFVHTCVKSQSTKLIYKKKYGLYRPLLIPNKPWENISMDFMTQLLEWNGMDAILMVVNRVSKLAKMVIIKMITTIFNLAKLLFDMWVKHHEIPQFIISDRDAKFRVNFFETILLKNGDKIII
jgi:hypothetical protein